MIRILYITRLQRVAVVVGGRLLRLLGPGWNLVWSLGREFVTYDLTDPVQALKVGDPLPEGTAGQRTLTVREDERVLVTIDGVQRKVLGAGRYRVWEGVADVALTRIDLLATPVPLDPSDRLTIAGAEAFEASTTAQSVAVLYRDGQAVEALGPGRYRAWRAGGWGLVGVPLALQAIEVAVQDLVTADQVTVRVKPTVAVRVVDALVWVRERATAEAQVYAAVQLALREVVASRALDALLTEREALGRAVLERARELLPAVGLAIEVAAVKDIVLPGEVKDLLNKVTLARKEAEAEAIRRREEVASTRQLANTAKLLEQNPILTRLKELEALGEILGKIDKVTLVGTGDLVKDVLLTQVRESTRE